MLSNRIKTETNKSPDCSYHAHSESNSQHCFPSSRSALARSVPSTIQRRPGQDRARTPCPARPPQPARAHPTGPGPPREAHGATRPHAASIATARHTLDGPARPLPDISHTHGPPLALAAPSGVHPPRKPRLPSSAPPGSHGRVFFVLARRRRCCSRHFLTPLGEPGKRSVGHQLPWLGKTYSSHQDQEVIFQTVFCGARVDHKIKTPSRQEFNNYC